MDEEVEKTILEFYLIFLMQWVQYLWYICRRFSKKEIYQLISDLKLPINQIRIRKGYHKSFEYDEDIT